MSSVHGLSRTVETRSKVLLGVTSWWGLALDGPDGLRRRWNIAEGTFDQDYHLSLMAPLLWGD